MRSNRFYCQARPTLAGRPRNFHVIDHAQITTEKPETHQHFHICSCRRPCHGEINGVDYITFIFVRVVYHASEIYGVDYNTTIFGCVVDATGVLIGAIEQ